MILRGGGPQIKRVLNVSCLGMSNIFSEKSNIVIDYVGGLIWSIYEPPPLIRISVWFQLQVEYLMLILNNANGLYVLFYKVPPNAEPLND